MSLPVEIHPTLDHRGRCLNCGCPVKSSALRFVGWRPLCEGTCPSCGHLHLWDLPTGHAFVYPSTIDLTGGEAAGQWFESQVIDGLGRPDGNDVAFSVERREPVDEAVLLNCLDFVYGHSLLKLLNAQHHLDDLHTPLIVLVPSALSSLVPEGPAEVWTVDEPFGRLRGAVPQLEEALLEEIGRLRRCTLSPAYPHPHPSAWDIGRFTGPLTARRVGEPSLLFVLREDRVWGGTPAEQRENLRATWATLRSAFPEAGAAAIGVSALSDLPAGMEDAQAEHPDARTEAAWLALMSGADLAIGVHGSNMLLPSALARATIELVPRHRYGNVANASLVTEPDPLLALFRHRFVYGDDELRDVTPQLVAELALTTIRDGPNFRERFAGALAGEVDAPLRPPEPRFEPEPEVEPRRGTLSRLLLRRGA